jgi:tripartite-type tricarboxylate transporter receptor subunit TctC
MQPITRRSLCCAALFAPLASALAQDFPSRPIKWVVPYLAGTSPDLTVRIVGEAMAAILKQPVVVENRPGAAGNLGAQQAARAAADGYTWVYSGSPMAAGMVLYRKPGYDMLKDFQHLGRIGISELTVISHPDSGMKTAQDLMDRARKNPGKLSFASGGIGSPAHLGAELMLNTAGAQAVHVPYKGASESVNAVIGKQVDFALTVTSVSLPHVNAGRLAALAVSSPTRNPLLPKVPTLTESGVAVKLVSFGGLSVPAGTPVPAAKRIADALNAALARPEVREKLESLGGQLAPSTQQEFTDALKAELALTERMVQLAGLEPQ